MNQDFYPAKNVYLDRDEHGVVRQLLHVPDPYRSPETAPRAVAAEYVRGHADLLGISAKELEKLDVRPSREIEDAGIEYRFLEEKENFDTRTIGYSQTIFGIPVWEAGLAVQIKQNPARVISVQSTRHADLSVERPDSEAVKSALAIDEIELAKHLGLVENARHHMFDANALHIERRSLVVFRYEAAKRQRDVAPHGGHLGFADANESSFVPAGQPTLPLPPADHVVEGRHYVCVKLDFSLVFRSGGVLHWVAILDVKSRTVLFVRPFVDSVDGLVFEIDPITTNGAPGPGATAASLNPVRVSRALQGLAAAVAGTQSLTGDTIKLEDTEAPTIAAPTEPAGTNFDFDARTNNFAAVNAYHHCDRFFRLLDGMGFSRPTFLNGTSFPSSVDHRGSMNTTDGIEVNAHCLGTMGGLGILRTTFALADLGDTTNPIGIACDYRVVLHELAGHGVLYSHVNSANFGFSHSAGDGVAAILNDPGSQAPDRFVTFPWVNIGRRHDRTPAAGWGWAGTIALNPFNVGIDRGGYNNEQILATTHFRVYRAIGGDSSDINTQRFAARMTVYLIMRAIAGLTAATNPANAAAWASVLMSADLGDWVSEGLTGGAYNKVIRWAFEKQGLYQIGGGATPNNNVGNPPLVDVYIDDGRAGEYQYQPVYWNCQKIWNRRNNDGGTTHEEPLTGRPNYAYVKVKNRGSNTATAVVVKAYHANPAAGLSYPIDWVPMTTSQLSGADVGPNSASEITVGPFQWTPTHVGHECLFMVVSALGDASNVSNIAGGDSIPEWRLVPNDNNIGQRNVFPISGGGTSGLVDALSGLTMTLKNPHPKEAHMEVRAELPAVLERRGWKVRFENIGGAAFTLRPGESRRLQVALVPGEDFTAADIETTQQRTIHLFGYADRILVGGNSYELDPHLDRGRAHPDCGKIANELLKCVALPDTVRRIRIRKVNLDIEFGDESCD